MTWELGNKGKKTALLKTLKLVDLYSVKKIFPGDS